MLRLFRPSFPSRDRQGAVLALSLLLALPALAQIHPAPSPDPGFANLPVQKIGANDLVAVSVYDAPEFTRTVRVGADGNIRLPMLHQLVRAQDLLPAELENAIAAALVAEQILVDPYVTVNIVAYESRPISVVGSVRTPLTFQAIGNVSLLEAITRAGGLAPDAGSEVLVTHSQPGPDGAPISLTRRVPIKSLIDEADPEVNIALHGGEQIRVPELGKIFIVGNVKKPGAFPLQDDDETTVLKALALTEGLAPYATKTAYIIRRDDRTGHKNELPIELDKIMKRQSPDVTLLANDILYVPDNSGRRNTLGVLAKIAAFGAATTSGVLIYSTIH
jgi:polysaccharide export outer membrane protein